MQATSTPQGERRTQRLNWTSLAALALLVQVPGASAAQAGVSLRLVPAEQGGNVLPDSFEEARQLLESVHANGELRIALPFRAAAGFDGITVSGARITIDAARRAFSIAGSRDGSGASTEFNLAGAWSRAGTPARCVIGLRPGAFALGQHVAALKGTLLDDLDLGGQTFVFADAAWPSLAELGDAGDWFGSRTLAVQPGWSFDGALDIAQLPQPMRAAAGLGDAGTIAISGSFDADLGLASGRAAVKRLNTGIRLPGSTASNDLPRWLGSARGGERTLNASFTAPSDVTLVMTRDIDVELGGEKRAFRLSANVGSATAPTIEAVMVEPWKAPFGLKWIDLKSATLRGSLASNDGAVATLEGQFDIAGKAATATLDIGSEGPRKLTVAIGKIALAELVSSGVVDGLPAQVAEPLEGLLESTALELGSASIALEPKNRTLTLAAQVSLRGTQSDFLYVTELPEWRGFAGGGGASGKSETAQSSTGSRASLFALRPMQLSLGRLFPRMLQIDALRDIASADLDLPAIFGGTGNLDIDLPDLPRGFGDMFSKLSLPSRTAGAAGAPNQEPSAGGFSLGKLRLPAGLNLSCRLPLPKLPANGSIARLSAIAGRLGGIQIDGLDISGSIGRKLEDLYLVAALPAFEPQLKLPWLKSGRLNLAILGSGSLSLAGEMTVLVHGEPLQLQLASTATKSASGGAELALEGTYNGTWKRALGIEWLELQDVRIGLALDEDTVAATCAASFSIGTRTARVELALEEKESASLVAMLDRAALSDLVALVGRSGAGGALERTGLDNALALSDIQIEIRTTAKSGAKPETSFFVGCSTSIAGKNADLLLALEPRGNATRTAIALRLPDVQLGTLVPGLRGTPGDLSFPTAVLTFGEGVGDGHALGLESTSLDLSRWMPAGGGDGIVFAQGLRFGGEIPLARMPAALKTAFGLTDNGAASIAFDGSIDATLSALSGKSAVKGLELRATLPATTPASELPAFLSSVDGGPRELRLSYAPGSGVALRSTREVSADLFGERRRFRMTAEVHSGAAKEALFEAALIGPWRAPFGLKWIELKSATLKGSLATSGQKGATFEGRFDLSGRPATLTIDIAAGAARNASGRLVVRTDRFALADVADLGFAERLPAEALEVIGGARLEVRDPTIAVELGQERSVSFSGRASLRGMEADVCLVVARRGGGPAAPVLVLRPDHFTLGSIAPALLQNDVTRDIAGRDLSGLLVLAGPNAKSIAAGDLPASLASFVPVNSRTGKAEAPLTPGLNLLAPLSVDALPKDGLLALGIERMRSALGVTVGSLQLSGSIGRVPADLDLRADFPPIAPRNAPKWLESGQLSIAITGKPSLAIEGQLGLLIDGEHLTFVVSGSMTRIGASPAVKFFGGLEANRPWKSPFGIEWLELEQVGLGLTADATASVTPSFTGTLKIGKKDLEIAAALRISPAGVPIGGMFHAKSDEGFALADLVQLQSRIAGVVAPAAGGKTPLAMLPDVALRQVEITLAPRDYPEEKVKQGLTLKGALYVPSKLNGPANRKLTSIDFAVSRTGIRGEGSLSAFTVGPLEFEGALVSLVLEPNDKHLMVSGDVQLLGHRRALELSVSREKLAFDAEVDLGGKWKADIHVAAPLDFELPKFSAAGLLPDDLLGNLRSNLQGAMDQLSQGFQDALVEAENQLAKALERRKARQKAIDDLVANLQKAIDAAKSAVETAQKDAEVARASMEAAEKKWKDTPNDKPVLKAARKKEFELAQATYDIGSNSKKAIWEAKQAILAELPKPADSPLVKNLTAQLVELVSDVRNRQTAVDKLRGAIKPLADFQKKHPGKRLFELKKGDFSLDLATLAKGGSLPVDFELRWLDDTRRIKGELSFGNLAASMHDVAQSVFPKLP